MSIRQTYNQVDLAVQTLVCQDAPLHARLEAAIELLSSLEEREFPPDCRKEFKQLLEKIHGYRVSGDRGDLQPDLAGSIYALLKKFIEVTWINSKFAL